MTHQLCQVSLHIVEINNERQNSLTWDRVDNRFPQAHDVRVWVQRGFKVVGKEVGAQVAQVEHSGGGGEGEEQ